jgi:hypothetical protein
MADVSQHLECIRVVIGMLQQIADYTAEDRYMDVYDVVVDAKHDLESITRLAFRVKEEDGDDADQDVANPWARCNQ